LQNPIVHEGPNLLRDIDTPVAFAVLSGEQLATLSRG
jgi:hypothetical protein